MRRDKLAVEEENFEFLDRVIDGSPVRFVRFLVRSSLYSQIRQDMRAIFSLLYETDATSLQALALKREVYRQHFSLCKPTVRFLESIGLTSSSVVERTQGRDVAAIWTRLHKFMALTESRPHPFMLLLEQQIDKAVAESNLQGERIWCGNEDIEFLTSTSTSLTENNFLIQPSEYRKSIPFQALNVIGPFRNRGRTALPKFVLSSPKFYEIRQIVWDNSYNDESYFRDPIVPEKDYGKIFYRIEDALVIDDIAEGLIPIFESAGEDVPDELDDFEFFHLRPIERASEKDCLAITFQDDVAVLVPRRTQHLIVTVDDEAASAEYLLAEMVQPGSFLIRHDVEADFGSEGSKNAQSKYASVWKSELKKLYLTDRPMLIRKMSQADINLKDLDRAARSWMDNNGETISGPQSVLHFKALISNVLNLNPKEIHYKKAWREIQGSRVSAILNGRVENAIVNEELQRYISGISEKVRDAASQGNQFKIAVDERYGLHGVLTFYKIEAVSGGYYAPMEKIGIITKLENIVDYQLEF